ncbi:MAG: hypothetical protein PHW60_05535 [Kiritimatiellae bacterium]|nr:hypothetical protein [Kiritimatiellia bacterium]
MVTARKIFSWFCLAFFLLAATPALSQNNTDVQPSATTAPVKPVLSTARSAGDQVLTEDQIADLLTEWTNEKTGAKLMFQSSFGLRTVTPQEKRKYVKSGKIPIRITCELFEIKESNGKKLAKRMTSGSARFYIMDSDGKVIEKKSVSLDKMCPS